MVIYSEQYREKLRKEIAHLEQKITLINNQKRQETKLDDHIFKTQLQEINEKIEEL